MQVQTIIIVYGRSHEVWWFATPQERACASIVDEELMFELEEQLDDAPFIVHAEDEIEVIMWCDDRTIQQVKESYRQDAQESGIGEAGAGCGDLVMDVLIEKGTGHHIIDDEDN